MIKPEVNKRANKRLDWVVKWNRDEDMLESFRM